MRLAYLDCTAGVAGDMCLGALIDCGVPLDYVQHKLKSMGIADEFELFASAVRRAGQMGTQVVVDTAGSGSPSPARHWTDIQHMLDTAELAPRVKARSLEVFQCLAEAEAKVHQTSVERVHFHEVGAVDAIVDIVGTCLGLEFLQVERLTSSPHPIGGGWVDASHGRMAVPVPAVMQLWEQGRVPIFSNGIEAELVTPTGAALAVALASQFGPCPSMRVERVGRGAGSRDLEIPNILRLWIGDSEGTDLTETVVVLETQIDDLNPQVIAYTFQRLQEAGALDVFSQAITMKQVRPGTLITVVCPVEKAHDCETVLFDETTTLGIRRTLQQRTILERTTDKVSTLYGDITVKLGIRYGQTVNAQPEFRDCVARAEEHRVPVQTVWLAAHKAWQDRSTKA